METLHKKQHLSMNTSHLMDTLNFFSLIMLYIVRKHAGKQGKQGKNKTQLCSPSLYCRKRQHKNNVHQNID
jgi:hypothetical protein